MDRKERSIDEGGSRDTPFEDVREDGEDSFADDEEISTNDDEGEIDILVDDMLQDIDGSYTTDRHFISSIDGL